jgi:hypothetical protein
MIDRIFWMWQLTPSTSLAADSHNEVLDPFKLTVRELLNIYQFGYDYASLQLLVEGWWVTTTRKRVQSISFKCDAN